MVVATSHISRFVRLVSRVGFACIVALAVLATSALTPRAQLALATTDHNMSAASEMPAPSGERENPSDEGALARELMKDASGEGGLERGLLDDAILSSAGATAFARPVAFLRLIGSAESLPRSAPQHLPFEPPRA